MVERLEALGGLSDEQHAAIEELAKTMKQFLVFELNMGQMLEDVQLALAGQGDVSFYGRPGGVIPTPNEVAKVISRLYYQKGLR